MKELNPILADAFKDDLWGRTARNWSVREAQRMRDAGELMVSARKHVCSAPLRAEEPYAGKDGRCRRCKFMAVVHGVCTVCGPGDK